MFVTMSCPVIAFTASISCSRIMGRFIVRVLDCADDSVITSLSALSHVFLLFSLCKIKGEKRADLIAAFYVFSHLVFSL